MVSRFREDARNSLGKLKRMPIELAGGGVIYLEQVASFEPEVSPGKIWRKNKTRMIQISADRGSHSYGDAVKAMEKAFKRVDFPKDYYYHFGETYYRMLDNQRELFFAVLVMLILIYLVLASLFESYIKPAVIMSTVPMAFIGAVLFLLIFRKSVNIGVLMGFIILGGIVVNNAIVMLDHITHRGSTVCLRPITGQVIVCARC